MYLKEINSFFISNLKSLCKRRLILLQTCLAPQNLNLKDHMLRFLRNQKLVTSAKNKFLIFSVPNWLCRWRAKNFLVKEPDTVAWIDSFYPGSVFWDVGANVGIFSIYASKFKDCRSYAFEPSVFNLEILARNLFNNYLEANITIIPLAVGVTTGSNMLIS